jgi:phosphatidylglycerol:prolipoprotein diacylglycerol transferase
MRQILVRIPLIVGDVPVWPFLLALTLIAAAALWFGAGRAAARWRWDPKNVRGAAVWAAVLGAVLTGLAYFFQKDGLPIFGFGMMLFLAFIVCNWIACRRARREGVSTEVVQDMAIWIIVCGLLGARLTSLLTSDPGFLRRPIPEMLISLLEITEGGIVLYGGVAGGIVGYVLAYWFGLRKQKIPTLKLADIVAPTLAVGLCIGRLGCFLNGCCFGQVACAGCPVCAVPFPLSAPARYELVAKGYQTAAGFTLKRHDNPFDHRLIVGQVEPGSDAEAKGLRADDEILDVDPDTPNASDNQHHPIDKYAEAAAYLGNFGGVGCFRRPEAGLQYSSLPRGKNDLTLVVRHADRAEATLTISPWTLGLHPTQLYESISMLLLFLLLTAYYPFRRRDGQVMAVLMVCYGVHRYLNELLRADLRPEGIESWTSVILIAAGLGLWLWLQFRPAQYRTVPAAGAAARKAAPASAAVRPAKA